MRLFCRQDSAARPEAERTEEEEVEEVKEVEEADKAEEVLA